MASQDSRTITALVCVLLPILSGAVVAQQVPNLNSSTPEYKCHVYSLIGGDTIIRFHQLSDLPARFSDAETFARASISDSTRSAVQSLHECVLVADSFSNPTANLLEQQLPQ